MPFVPRDTNPWRGREGFHNHKISSEFFFWRINLFCFIGVKVSTKWRKYTETHVFVLPFKFLTCNHKNMRVSMYFLHLELTYTSLHGGSCEYRDWYAGWTMPSTEPNSRGSLGTRLAIISWLLC